MQKFIYVYGQRKRRGTKFKILVTEEIEEKNKYMGEIHIFYDNIYM